jgi:hypothetical protein
MSAADATPAFLIVSRGKGAAGLWLERRFSYGILTLFDHKSEPVIDNGTENGNMLAAVVDSWANYRHASRVA